MQDKYVLFLLKVAAWIVLPAAAVHAIGAPLGLLVVMAFLQCLALLPLYLTSLVSFLLCLNAIGERNWMKAAVRGGATLIPFAAGHLVLLTNSQGWGAMMSV